MISNSKKSKVLNEDSPTKTTKSQVSSSLHGSHKNQILPVFSQFLSFQDKHGPKQFCTSDALMPYFDNNHQFKKHYKVIKNIGFGAYSQIYSVKNRKTDQENAVKIFETRGMAREQIFIIVQEAQLIQKLNHENIVGFKDFFVGQNHIFIVTEKLDMDLQDFLSKQWTKQTEKDIRLIFRKICQGVQFCHKNNIIHQDIKPENILVNIDKKNQLVNVKLADLGMARETNEGDKMSVSYNGVMGTQGYQAPELFLFEENNNQYDQKIDVWSLGILLYNLVTGNMPFYGIADEVQYKIIHEDPDYDDIQWTQYSPQVENLSKLLLNKDPQNRLDIDEILNHPWLKDDNNDSNKRSKFISMLKRKKNQQD